MCFEKNNENFIKIELHANMKGLTDEEKLINYEVIKDETRKRLKSAYTDCENLFSFYEEAFNYLHFFDLDFLLLNLFFEKEGSNIFLYLSNESLSMNKISHKTLFSSRLYNDMMCTFSNDLDEDFLKLNFTKLLNLNSNDWASVQTELNEVVKKYASWLMEENKKGIKTDVNKYTYFVFCKIWNSYGSYRENFSTKAIVFYNTLNEKFSELIKKGFYFDLSQMIYELKGLKDDLFVKELEFYPLLDQEKNTSNGYNIQRKKFNGYVKVSKSLSISYAKYSFDSIFKNLISAEAILCEKLEREINKKLDNLKIPNQDELNKILAINLEGEKHIIREKFLKRLYVY